MPGKNSINSNRVQACVAALRSSVAPLSISEIAIAGLGKKQGAAFHSALAAELTGLAAEAGVYEWPRHGTSRIFSGRPVQAAVEEAFLAALEEQPLTISQAARPMSRRLRRVSEAVALKQLKAIAPGLLAEKRIFAFSVNRQSVVYFSFAWAERQIPQRKPEPLLEDVILEAVRQLQPGEGNYVAVDSLRRMPAIRSILDDAVIHLAATGRLVIGRYDGPRPVPDDEAARYVADAKGELFIAVALPRA